MDNNTLLAILKELLIIFAIPTGISFVFFILTATCYKPDNIFYTHLKTLSIVMFIGFIASTIFTIRQLLYSTIPGIALILSIIVYSIYIIFVSLFFIYHHIL